ncbi:hypothetical protein SPMU_04200 [Sphingomonas mucosissima]|uniref:Uncharacterized protein n=2 Tax=Sphingomonas mucosissima TaxID=370959 RepID=A0A245ZQT0_9SPHN|nr:hypothetical protein SPMU_04200 [Sphingomonas mucosissima]
MRLIRPSVLAMLAMTAPLSAQQAGEAVISPSKVVILPPPSRPAALPGAPRTSRQTLPTETSRSAPVNGVLVLYGNERCPTNNNGEEIVVCQRRGAEEQFRIPKEVRTLEVTPENESWAAREKGNQDVGNVGIGSCTTVGPGGGTGCFVQNARRSKREAQARNKDATPDLSPY